MLVAVEHLLPGMAVDLGGDPYADPNRDNPALEDEYQRVWSVEEETLSCTCVYFDYDAVGFPRHHKVKVRYATSEKP